jgi:hypothetical protein
MGHGFDIEDEKQAEERVTWGKRRRKRKREREMEGR